MMQTGKAYHKSIPVAWLQPVGDGSRKWRVEGIAPNPIRKQQVLRYFDFVDDHLPAEIEFQVSPGPPPIRVGPSAQQQGVVNEGVPPDAGGDAPAAPHPDGIPPDDSLFGSDLLRNPQHEGGAEQRSVHLESLEALAAFDFKKGSTNIPAKEEEVREAKFNEAMRDEWLQNICGQEVFRRAVPREEAKMVIDLGWRLTWKEKEAEKGKGKERKYRSPSPSHSPPTATKRVPKARCFGKGFRDKRKIDTFTGTPVPALIFFCMIWALACALQIFVGDVKGAFLQSTDTNAERVYACMPVWMSPIPDVCPYPDMKPENWERVKEYARSLLPGQIREVVRGLYGMPVSSKLFDNKWVGITRRAGFERIELGIAVDKKKNVLINWIDDVFGLIAFGQVERVMRHLQGEMEFGKMTRLDMASYKFKYAGMDFEGDKGECRVSMSSYLEGVDTNKLFREYKIPRRGVGGTSLCKEKDFHLQEGKQPDLSLKDIYSSVIGCLGWGGRLSPFRRVWYDILSRYRKTPTHRHLAIAVRILHKIKKDPEGLNFHRLSRSPLLKMVFFIDSSHEKDTYEGSHAWIALLVDHAWKPGDELFNIFAWRSMRLTVKLGSSTASELVGFEQCLKRVPRLISFGRNFQKDMPVQFLIDCNPLHDQFRSGVADSDTRMQHVLDWCIQRCKQLSASVVWIPCEIQAAIALTKPIAFGQSIYD